MIKKDIKMIYKYLYIDDESKSVRDSFAQNLTNEFIKVDTMHVFNINLHNTEDVINLLSNYHGLLLDLRLDQIANEESKIKVPFTATVYAQHIRTLVTNGDICKDIPIVLFSTDDKLKKVYSIDLTSQDLFDRYIEKTKIPYNAKSKLISLAKGYIEINNDKKIDKLLSLNNLDYIDDRLFARYSDGLLIPTHEYAQTILKDLIYPQGILINELMLSSRLGIDVEKSEDWKKLQDYFKNAKYKGVFSDGWCRWWMYLIDDIFYEKTENYLSYLDANERVELLKKITGFKKLVAADPIRENHSNRFWTYCKVLEKPLDPLEGFKINNPIDPKPWQEYDYCSLLSILEQKYKNKGLTIHPSDRERLEIIRSEY